MCNQTLSSVANRQLQQLTSHFGYALVQENLQGQLLFPQAEVLQHMAPQGSQSNQNFHLEKYNK